MVKKKNENKENSIKKDTLYYNYRDINSKWKMNGHV